MKNLKKAFALVLTVAMLMSMMVFAAGAADFTDSDKVVNTEAVDTMVALNIINGKGDGSYFDPTGIVTRGEMAKMICVALNGGKDPQVGTATSFTDTKGHWAAGYIEYCANLGIVSGRGNGIFDPNATVTATEAAKMLLVAIGYDSDAEGFTGATWAVAVNVRASQKDIYEDLDLDVSAGLTRDNAAQMVYNAINAVMVTYEYKLVTGADGQLATKGVAEDNGTKTIATEKFKLNTEYAYMTDISYSTTTEKYTYTLSASTNFGAAAIATDGVSGTFSTKADYSDLFGMKVKILYKTVNSTTTVYGIYAEDSSVMVSGIVGSLPTIAAADTTFKYSSVSYKVDSGAIAVYEYNNSTSVGVLNSYKASATNHYSFKLVDNDDDGKADCVIALPYTVVKATYVGATSITAGNVSYKFADADIADDIAKNDYVIVYAAANTAKGLDTIVKAEVVSGSVSALENSTKPTVDGTAYKLAATYTTPPTFKIGSTYDLVVVNGYYFYAEKVSGTASTENVVLATSKNTTALTSITNTLQTQLMFADGTKKVVEVKKVNDVTVTAVGDVTVGTIYTYEINSDGYYELSTITAGDYDAYATGATISTIKSGKISVTAGSGSSTTGTYYFDSNAVVFYYNGSAYKATTGATANKWADLTGGYTTNVLYANKSSGFNYTQLAFINLGTTPDAGDLSYGWITAAPTVVLVDSTYYLQLKVWNGTEVATYLADKYCDVNTGVPTTYVTVGSGTANSMPSNIAKGNPIVFSDSGSGKITNVYGFKATANAVVAYADGSDDVVFESAITGASNASIRTLTIEDDSVVLYVDTENNAGVAGGSITVANSPVSGGYVKNAYVLANSADEIKVIVVDTANSLTTNSSTASGTVTGSVTAINTSTNVITLANATLRTTAQTDLEAAFSAAIGVTLSGSSTYVQNGETVVVYAADGTAKTYTVATTVTNAAAPTAVALTGGTAPVTVASGDLLAGVGSLTGWAANTADEVVLTVTAAAGTTATITINGVAYTSGTDYTIAATGTYTVVVTSSQAGYATTTYTYTFTVA